MLGEFVSSLFAGAVAGFAVDGILFPLDTIKTRLQSGNFVKSGAFSSLYSGLGSALLGSAPSAALFFGVYSTLNGLLLKSEKISDAGAYMISASLGESAACLVRVPTDVIKQRMQVGMFSTARLAINDIHSRNGVSGFYRGFKMTIFREIPFACIQFPLYEKLKAIWGNYKERDGAKVSSFQAACCGWVAGGTGFSLESNYVVKIGKSPGILKTFSDISRQEGRMAFMAGVIPRAFWISLGGSIFLGVYDVTNDLVLQL